MPVTEITVGAQDDNQGVVPPRPEASPWTCCVRHEIRRLPSRSGAGPNGAWLCLMSEPVPGLRVEARWRVPALVSPTSFPKERAGVGLSSLSCP